MNKVLIIGDGNVANVFIKKLVTQASNDFKFKIILKERQEIKYKNSNMEFDILDPTSSFRLKNSLEYGYSSTIFTAVFIVMERPDEALSVYNNIREMYKRVRITILDNNKDFERDKIELDSNTVIVDALEIISNRLYYLLPNVPITAQSIGIGSGEIMEVSVPFASIYAFRHINTIPQHNWKIIGYYRDNQFHMVIDSNKMRARRRKKDKNKEDNDDELFIRPGDRLLLVGNPNILINVFNRIKNISVAFPEPYGQNFYLYLDLNLDESKALRYLNEAVYFIKKFQNKRLFVKVFNPNSLEILEAIKEFECDIVDIYISYVSTPEKDIKKDIEEKDIGLVMVSFKNFKRSKLRNILYNSKKLVYIFGKKELKDIKKSFVVKSEIKEMMEISVIAFYIAEALKIELVLGIHMPDGNFEESKEIIEHFRSLSHVHNSNIKIDKQKLNPYRAIKKEKGALILLPFKQNIKFGSILSIFSKDSIGHIFRITKHPKLLIPVEDGI